MDRLEQLLTDEVRKLFPPPLDEEYFAEVERHDRELRDIPTRYVSELHVTFHQAMERAIAYGPGPADEAGFELLTDFNDLQDGQDISIREAMEAEHAKHRRFMADPERRAAEQRA